MLRTEPLGLIAGKGELPGMVCETAAKRGIPVTAVTFEEATTGMLEKLADTAQMALGQAEKIIRRFRDAGVRRVCLIGKIDKKLAFSKLTFDIRALKLMKRIMRKDDTSIMLAIIEELESEGFEVVRQTDWLPDLMPDKGVLGKKKPDARIKDDFEYGLGLCRDLAGKEIGQTIIVKEGTVLAVEAVEGTDAAIERGCSLGGEGGVMIKTSRPGQDLRYDIPSIGPDTVKLLEKHKAAALGIESGGVVAINLPSIREICDRAGIVLAAL